eukprot:gnl/Chilomastix_cuspidata/761.p1 GENE.gnl/Chilomastix_cuspidata/761~~gnl/Chilomastix_cuspidata/761.p1  ORF type:complete len:397 (+),score=136.71 gnl/Chilomastix_cuspidata/761:38-1228(+)
MDARTVARLEGPQPVVIVKSAHSIPEENLCVLEQVSKEKKQDLIVTSKEGTAAPFVTIPSTSTTMKSYIVIKSRSKKTITVLPAMGTAQILPVPGTLDGEDTIEDTDVRGQHFKAVAAYGSRKRQRSARMVNANTIKLGDTAAATRQSLEALGTETVTANDILYDQREALRYIPMHNPTALTPQEAYPIAEILPLQQALEQGRAPVDYLLNAPKLKIDPDKLEDTTILTRTAATRALLLRKVSRSERLQVAYLLSFIDMATFFLQNVRGRRTTCKFPADTALGCPIMLEHIKKEFFLKRSTGNMLSEPLRLDKLRCTLFVALLWVDNFETPVDDLARDLKMITRDCSQYFRELGCTLITPSRARRKGDAADKGVVAILKVFPLKFPVQRSIPSGRR